MATLETDNHKQLSKTGIPSATALLPQYRRPILEKHSSLLVHFLTPPVLYLSGHHRESLLYIDATLGTNFLEYHTMFES